MRPAAALLLTFVIALMISVVSADFFFRQANYELGDEAANSLSVDRAKHFGELYGAYSRWGFHHPGPAFFYVQALGEGLFYDTLHVVPAPYNAQALVCLFMEVGFFIAALQVFTRWLPTRACWWFFPLAMGIAALHFGNAPPNHPELLLASTAFQTSWAPHVAVLVFLCLLAASASVAAGRGGELPLLVLACSLLVHAHVAQPLFVLPCSLLAYAGLLFAHWRSPRPPETGKPTTAGALPPRWRETLHRLGGPWRHHRSAHILAFGILAVFVLPLAVDLARGPRSNFHTIVDHVRTHKGQHKPFLQSFFYFLQFGSYRTYQPGSTSFDRYDLAGMGYYLRANAAFYLLWAVVAGTAAWTLAGTLWNWARSRVVEPLDRFLAWGAAYLFLAFVLTLRWGVIQDGEMFYYNAWFNFGIYFFAALLAVAAVLRLSLWLLRRLGDPVFDLPELTLASLAAVLVTAWFVARLKIVDAALPGRAAVHGQILQTIAQSRSGRTTNYLSFPQVTWPYMVGVALQLDRAHKHFIVPSRWGDMFGAEHTVSPEAAARTRIDAEWSIIDSTNRKAAQEANYPLVSLNKELSLSVTPPSRVDLNDGEKATLDFRGSELAPQFEITGWTGAGSWGEWTEGKRAVITFPAAPVAEEVEMTIDCFPYVDPKHGLPAQRLNVVFNGETIAADLRLDQEDGAPPALAISPAVWNKVRTQANSLAVLELNLPDAIAPLQLNPDAPGDVRAIGLGVKEITLRQLRPTQDSPTPTEIAFDGQPLPLGKARGIAPDGWAGRESTIVLPYNRGSEVPCIRLVGLALEKAPFTYPYHFTVNLDRSPGTDVVLAKPGPFDIVVPTARSANALRNVPVHLVFSQTFSPAQVDPASGDTRTLSLLLRSVSISSAQHPMLVSFRQGWSDQETNGQSHWRWGDVSSVTEVANDRAGTLVIQGEAGTQVAGNTLDLLLDGKTVASLFLETTGWKSVAVRIPLAAGKHELVFRSQLPGFQPPGDARTIGLGIKDAEFRLE